MRASLDVATDPWGIKVNRVELKNIIPPAAIQDAMEKQMKAERERREAILRAEGEKKSTVLVAEGEKESVILKAEAEKQAAILQAEAEKEKRIKEAEGEAEAILKVQQANADGIRFIREAGADQAVLTIKSLEAFEKAADGKATMILEDELTSLQALSEILTTYSDDIRVHKASSLKEAKDLLDQEIRYGLFLLDVNLSGEDREDIGGILFAREIRERFEYTFTPIVMVTAIGNMEMQAYRELHCYQYIMKPFHREQVEEVVQKVLEKESREKSPVIVVKKDGINYQLKCEDIRYLEAIPRGTRLHLVTENWDVPYVTLRQMLLKMPKGMFAQCHRMYAVNKNEVEYYDTVNRIIRIKNCPDTVEIGVTYKSVIGGLLNG